MFLVCNKLRLLTVFCAIFFNVITLVADDADEDVTPRALLGTFTRWRTHSIPAPSFSAWTCRWDTGCSASCWCRAGGRGCVPFSSSCLCPSCRVPSWSACARGRAGLPRGSGRVGRGSSPRCAPSGCATGIPTPARRTQHKTRRFSLPDETVCCNNARASSLTPCQNCSAESNAFWLHSLRSVHLLAAGYVSSWARSTHLTDSD